MSQTIVGKSPSKLRGRTNFECNLIAFVIIWQISGDIVGSFGISEMSTEATLHLDEVANDEVKMDILESNRHCCE
jgi:hypothetical protein